MVLLLGCSLIQSPPSILEQLVCAPPCWQNIIPGETTEQEVLDIMAGLQDIDKGSIFNRGFPWSGYSNIIRFSFDNNNYPVSVSIYFIDGTVGLITMYENLGESISSAINILGEPKSVFIAYQHYFIPTLFNDDIGVVILYH